MTNFGLKELPKSQLKVAIFQKNKHGYNVLDYLHCVYVRIARQLPKYRKKTKLKNSGSQSHICGSSCSTAKPHMWLIVLRGLIPLALYAESLNDG